MRIETQNAKIKAYLNTGKTITPAEAFNIIGTMKLATRIGEVKRDGFPVDSEWVKTADGKRFKKYWKGAAVQRGHS